MSQNLGLKPGDKVLEVGTGSGYQAAVLAELGARVFSIEIVETLAHEAAARLKNLGYESIQTRVGDGYLGWPEEAPFDAVIVTAAPDHVPPAPQESAAATAGGSSCPSVTPTKSCSSSRAAAMRSTRRSSCPFGSFP
jgi:protein-L-isoaspartate(D-aspartate) O-methyltransferase